jgi:hypothetical protein
MTLSKRVVTNRFLGRVNWPTQASTLGVVGAILCNPQTGGREDQTIEYHDADGPLASRGQRPA